MSPCELEGLISEAEDEMAALDSEMLQAGADLSRLGELSATKETLQEKLDAWYAEWDDLEALLADDELAPA